MPNLVIDYKGILDEIERMMTEDAGGRAAAIEKWWRGAVDMDSAQAYEKWGAILYDDEGPDAFIDNRNKTVVVHPIVTVAAYNLNSAEDAYDDLLNLLGDSAGNGVMTILRDKANIRLGNLIRRLGVQSVRWDNTLGAQWYLSVAEIRLECHIDFEYA